MVINIFASFHLFLFTSLHLYHIYLHLHLCLCHYARSHINWTLTFISVILSVQVGSNQLDNVHEYCFWPPFPRILKESPPFDISTPNFTIRPSLTSQTIFLNYNHVAVAIYATLVYAGAPIVAQMKFAILLHISAHYTHVFIWCKFGAYSLRACWGK